jgi:hypothetical protein
MARASRNKLSSRAQAKKWNAMMVRAKRSQSLRRKGELLIPTQVLQMLQAMHLPKDCRVYNAKLRELLGA